MNVNQKLETFKLYYSGIVIKKGDMLICRAKNSKDLKARVAKAINYIVGLSLPLKVVINSNNSFTVKPIFQHEPAFKN